MKKIKHVSDGRTFIGIDVAKEELAIFNDSTDEHFTCLNQKKALRELAGRLKKLNPTLIVMEATGGYEMLAAKVFQEFELPFAVIHPLRVRQFAFSLGLIAKTDEIDAETIAYYGRVAGVEAKPLQSEELEELRDLTGRRRQLIEMRIVEENRLETASEKLGKNIRKHLDWLLKEISRVESEIAKCMKETEEFQSSAELLKTVPGVGAVLSTTLITELPELGVLADKKLSSLVGVAPFAHQSGNWKGKRYCQGGRASVRSVLYMATLSAVRCNPVIKEFYEKLCSKGKAKKVAIIACARKLLSILNSMVRNNRRWEVKVKQVVF